MIYIVGVGKKLTHTILCTQTYLERLKPLIFHLLKKNGIQPSQYLSTPGYIIIPLGYDPYNNTQRYWRNGSGSIGPTGPSTEEDLCFKFKPRQALHTSYILQGLTLEAVSCAKYLGEDRSWKPRISRITSYVNKFLWFLRKNFKGIRKVSQKVVPLHNGFMTLLCNYLICDME